MPTSYRNKSKIRAVVMSVLSVSAMAVPSVIPEAKFSHPVRKHIGTVIFIYLYVYKKGAKRDLNTLYEATLPIGGGISSK